ncbi:MAG TPA: DUF5678 domain-containing protein [Patescibacteria group bacterium]|nr:DUF5678 domain-containing protein [Patescibacteria group bacterium]
MRTTNFKEIHKRYKGKWVALTSDERSVISSGKTAKEVYDQAHKKGFKEPILMKVPPEVAIYVGFIKIKD